MTARLVDDTLAASAVAAADHPAVVASDEHLTYGAFDAAATAVASGLRGLGVGRGDRVAVAVTNSANAAIGIYGVLRAGGIVVPLNATIKADRLGRVVAASGAVVVIADSAVSGVVTDARRAAPAVRHVVGADAAIGADPSLAELRASRPVVLPGRVDCDVAAVIYTSGSTGDPKGVTLTHHNIMFASGSIIEYLGLGARDRILCCLPLSFDYGLYQLLMAVRVGASVVLERGFAFPGRVIGLLETEHVTCLPGVPTLFTMLVGLRGIADHNLPALRLLTNTGAALPVATITRLRRAFPNAALVSMYGLTECKRVSYLPPSELDRRPDSVGIPIPGTEAWVARGDGSVADTGEVGELMVRGSHVMRGYWNDPDATRERLRPGRYPWESVLATGDLFRRDADGFLYFVARRDQVLKSRGEKVAPREVEEAIAAYAGVRDVVVVGAADPLLGEAIHAHVSPNNGAELDERTLRRHCASLLEDAKVPQRIIIHAELPRTAAGKIDRAALADTDATTKTP
jgi:long-chain acyl-CoA synthetase